MNRTFLLALLFAATSPALAQVYRCDTPQGTAYQPTPCADPAQQRTLKDNLSVIQGGSYPSSEVLQVEQGQSLQLLRGNAVAPSEPARCNHLRRRIGEIDRQARVRSTQRLTDERRAARKQFYELRCQNFPPG